MIIAYNDWNKQLNYLTNAQSMRNNKALHTIRYINQLQYDDNEPNLRIDQMIYKIMDLGLNILYHNRDEIISKQWHYTLNRTEREDICEKLFPGLFSQEEKDLLFNFAHGGHRLMYLFISSAIESLETEENLSLSNFDTVSRYKAILGRQLDKHYNNKGKEIVSQLVEDILVSQKTKEEIINEYVDNNVTKESSINEKAIASINTIYQKITTYKTNRESLTKQDLTIILKHFKQFHSLIYDGSNNILPISIVREQAHWYADSQLDSLFNAYNISRSEDVKYVYACNDSDPSMRFLFENCKKNLVENVKDFSSDLGAFDYAE